MDKGDVSNAGGKTIRSKETCSTDSDNSYNAGGPLEYPRWREDLFPGLI